MRTVIRTTMVAVDVRDLRRSRMMYLWRRVGSLRVMAARAEARRAGATVPKPAAGDDRADDATPAPV